MSIRKQIAGVLLSQSYGTVMASIGFCETWADSMAAPGLQTYRCGRAPGDVCDVAVWKASSPASSVGVLIGSIEPA